MKRFGTLRLLIELGIALLTIFFIALAGLSLATGFLEKLDPSSANRILVATIALIVLTVARFAITVFEHRAPLTQEKPPTSVPNEIPLLGPTGTTELSQAAARLIDIQLATVDSLSSKFQTIAGVSLSFAALYVGVLAIEQPEQGPWLIGLEISGVAATVIALGSAFSGLKARTWLGGPSLINLAKETSIASTQQTESSYARLVARSYIIRHHANQDQLTYLAVLLVVSFWAMLAEFGLLIAAGLFVAFR